MGYQRALAIMWPPHDVTAALCFGGGSMLRPRPPHCRAAPGKRGEDGRGSMSEGTKWEGLLILLYDFPFSEDLYRHTHTQAGRHTGSPFVTQPPTISTDY